MTEPTAPADQTPHIPVSWGELIDKITILEIKNARITSESALRNVRTELAELRAILDRGLSCTPRITELQSQLREVNETLWEVEEDIRRKEDQSKFDEDFIALARSVYKTNDVRSRLKREINALTGSAIVEEKSY